MAKYEIKDLHQKFVRFPNKSTSTYVLLRCALDRLQAWDVSTNADSRYWFDPITEEEINEKFAFGEIVFDDKQSESPLHAAWLAAQSSVNPPPVPTKVEDAPTTELKEWDEHTLVELLAVVSGVSNRAYLHYLRYDPRYGSWFTCRYPLPLRKGKKQVSPRMCRAEANGSDLLKDISATGASTAFLQISGPELSAEQLSESLPDKIRNKPNVATTNYRQVGGDGDGDIHPSWSITILCNHPTEPDQLIAKLNNSPRDKHTIAVIREGATLHLLKPDSPSLMADRVEAFVAKELEELAKQEAESEYEDEYEDDDF